MRKFILAASMLALTACQARLDPVKVHADTLTLDTHIDIPLNYMTEIDPSRDTDLQVDIPKLISGGLDSGFWIIYTPQGDLTEAGYAQGFQIAQTRAQAISALTQKHADKVGLAKTAADVRQIVSEGKQAVLIGMENAYPLGEVCEKTIRGFQDCHDTVDGWAQLGVRYMGITHFGHNQFGDSSNPNFLRDSGPKWQGLSGQGVALINAMNESGIMVDVSHAGKMTMMQAADMSKTPIIASHSGVKAIGDSPRNLDDEQLRKIRDVGGVAQMVALGAYVKPLSQAQLDFRDGVRVSLGLMTDKDLSEMSEETAKLYGDMLKPMFDMETPASVADFVDHIDHAVKVAGIDHVGIASDFDGGGGVTSWQDASETLNVTAELIKRGYNEQDIAKIWGGNLLRVMEAVEAEAGK